MNWCTVCICLPLFVKLDQHCLPELTSMIELFSNQCCPIWNTIATCGNWVLENEELVCTLYLIFNTFNCHMWLLATIMDNMYLDNCIFPLGKDIYIYIMCVLIKLSTWRWENNPLDTVIIPRKWSYPQYLCYQKQSCSLYANSHTYTH